MHQVGDQTKVRNNKLTYIVASCWLLSQLSYSDLLFLMKSHYGHFVHESLSTLYIATKIFGIAGLLPKYTLH